MPESPKSKFGVLYLASISVDVPAGLKSFPVLWLYTYPALSPWYIFSTLSLLNPDAKPCACMPIVCDHSNPSGVIVPIIPFEVTASSIVEL